MNGAAVVSIALLVAVAGAIFLLARQDVQGTRDLAWRVEQLLVRLVPPTGTGSIGEPTWWGLTIRRLAHIAEYALLGLGATLSAFALRGVSLSAVGGALALCAVTSLADEAHKTLVPGRHFDAADLALDAAGYLAATLITWAVASLVG